MTISLRGLMNPLLAAIALLTVSACAGPTPTNPGPVSPQLSAVSGSVAAGDVLGAVNAFRASEGRAALTYAPVLAQVAQQHSADMAARGVMSHQGGDGSTVGSRASRAGYSWCRIAENVAMGQKDLSTVMTAWQNSPGHRRNLLDPNVTEVGLGRVGDYWTMMLAAPGCAGG